MNMLNWQREQSYVEVRNKFLASEDAATLLLGSQVWLVRFICNSLYLCSMET